jgi:hypothetical protein
VGHADLHEEAVVPGCCRGGVRCDLVRRITSSVTSPTQNATTTITYRGWGEPVAIKVPAASDVTDPSALVS